jgi:hypothetical protein
MFVTHKDVYTIVKALSTALVVITTADLLRFSSRRFARTYERLLGFLMRESEKVCPAGSLVKRVQVKLTWFFSLYRRRGMVSFGISSASSLY